VIYRGNGHARIESPDNAIAITLQASGWAKIDPLMVAFNAIALMATNYCATWLIREAVEVE
jgi:phage terminase large subunit-like protein